MINVFLFFLCSASTISMINNGWLSSSILKNGIYGLMFLFIGWMSYVLLRKSKKNNGAWQVFLPRKLVFFYLFLFANFILSRYSPNFSLLLKYLAYGLCFYLGAYFVKERISVSPNNFLLFFTILLPLFLVGFVDKTAHKSTFFVLSNMYSLTGLGLSLFYYTVNYGKKNAFRNAFIILGCFILSCSSLGIVGALVLCVLFVNRKSFKLMAITMLLGVILVVLINYSNIEIFKRIRDVFRVFGSLSINDWFHLRDLDLYKVSQNVTYESSRNDNTSALWRLAHWEALVEDFLLNFRYAFVLGLGDNYAFKVLKNYPHCEYLRCMCEYGLVVFFIVLKWIRSLWKVVGKDQSFYFIGMFLFYACTENIIDTFVANSLIFFCIGFHYTQCKMRFLNRY